MIVLRYSVKIIHIKFNANLSHEYCLLDFSFIISKQHLRCSNVGHRKMSCTNLENRRKYILFGRYTNSKLIIPACIWPITFQGAVFQFSFRIKIIESLQSLQAVCASPQQPQILDRHLSVQLQNHPITIKMKWRQRMIKKMDPFFSQRM